MKRPRQPPSHTLPQLPKWKGISIEKHEPAQTSLMSVGDASELINNKLGTHILHISIIRVGKMFRINALAIVSAHAIALAKKCQSVKPQFLREKAHERSQKKKKTHRVANIQRSRNKARGNAVAAIVL